MGFFLRDQSQRTADLTIPLLQPSFPHEKGVWGPFTGKLSGEDHPMLPHTILLGLLPLTENLTISPPLVFSNFT